MAKEYRGVKWVSKYFKWQASVRHNGVTYPCGMHDEQMDAVKARDKKIIEHGLNVPLQIFSPVKKTKK